MSRRALNAISLKQIRPTSGCASRLIFDNERNGQAEVTNREILRGLCTWLDHAGGSWVDELPSVLWAYRITPREVTGITPFQLVYGGEAVMPVEGGVESNRVSLYDEDNADWRLMELDLVNEARDKAVVWLTAYQHRMKQSYNH
ncbi:uncharacterized protein LOC122005851 [Zingiber officinale]|uniref:uncharacterized protein LOC122005851 n=1 Tax=Zingiber officinale TaxID=94328 RepID=UPI001C4DC33B|nr:uncharacterized protein LOC122005851 [Zingiber officinale]